jgi:hypothetical protein
MSALTDYVSSESDGRNDDGDESQLPSQKEEKRRKERNSPPAAPFLPAQAAQSPNTNPGGLGCLT